MKTTLEESLNFLNGGWKDVQREQTQSSRRYERNEGTIGCDQKRKQREYDYGTGITSGDEV